MNNGTVWRPLPLTPTSRYASYDRRTDKIRVLLTSPQEAQKSSQNHKMTTLIDILSRHVPLIPKNAGDSRKKWGQN